MLTDGRARRAAARASAGATKCSRFCHRKSSARSRDFHSSSSSECESKNSAEPLTCGVLGRPGRADQFRDGRRDDEDLPAVGLGARDLFLEHAERAGQRHFVLRELGARDVLQVGDRVGIVDDGDGRHDVAADRAVEYDVGVAQRGEDLHRAGIAAGVIEIGDLLADRRVDDVGRRVRSAAMFSRICAIRAPGWRSVAR